MKSYDISDYDYDLPRGLIAQYPLSKRTDARLMNLSAAGIEDTYIRHLPQLLRKDDVLVFNNTRVLPMRFFAIKKSGGKVEVLLNRILNKNEGEALVRSSRPIPIKSHLSINPNRNAELQVIGRHNEFYLVKSPPNISLMNLCRLYGQVPLPPYIDRDPLPQDKRRYQTVFAKEAGAAAAPTAGLHFSKALLHAIEAAGIMRLELTLHTGAATFAPIRTTDISKHKMHSEWCELSPAVAQRLNDAKARKRRIIAVGTTSLRVLETAYRPKHSFQAYKGETNLFIHPGSEPIRSVDMLVTNFHLPRSSLLFLVSAFGGYELIMQAYRHAIKHSYRFFSYGDAMLIPRAD